MKISSSLQLGWLLISSLVWFCLDTLQAEERIAGPIIGQQINGQQIKQHVDFLAHPDREGRDGWGKLQSAEYIIKSFKDNQLKPFFNGSYLQKVPDLGDNSERPVIVGQNIGSYVEGTDPLLKQEFIVINAHYDHLGIKRGFTYPGADDNASGVSMMLEVARELAKNPPRRSVAFVAFDLEEYLLWGSRWFVAHPPVKIEQIKLCITADMIGRSLGGLDLPTVFVLGSEHSAEVQKALTSVHISDDIELAKLGVDIIGTRSDYGPFRAQEIPFLFFSTGEHPDYHMPSDTPDKINVNKTASISNLILELVQYLGNNDMAPQWQESKEADLAEANAINQVTDHLLNAAQQGEFELSNVQRFFVSQVHSKTRYMITQQRVTKEERAWMKRATQLLMLSVF